MSADPPTDKLDALIAWFADPVAQAEFAARAAAEYAEACDIEDARAMRGAIAKAAASSSKPLDPWQQARKTREAIFGPMPKT